MAPLVVDPAALDGAGTSLTGVGEDIGQTLSTLTGALSGGGSMCGNDPVGEAMGNAYDRSADALVKAVAAARNSLVNLGDGVRMSAFNYSVAEAQSDVSRRAQPLPPPQSTGKISASSPPSSVGAGDSAPAGWGWVAKYIGMIWPNGDSAKLRGAAGAWIAAGSQLVVTETSAAASLGIVGAQQIPEGEMIGRAFSTSLAAASQIMSQTATVAGQLSGYANQIDEVHAAILDLLSRICDPMTGIKEIWDILTDEDEDEIKQIADDIKTVVDNFSSEASALVSELSTALTAAETVVSEIGSYADKEWDQFLHGTDVGRALNQVGQVVKGIGLEAGGMVEDIAVSVWKYNAVRIAVDPEGWYDDASAQLGGMAPLVGLGGDGAPAVLDVWKQVGKDVSHWDMWGTNPAEAAGRTATDVASLFIPGGASAKVTGATHALENAAEHLPGAVEHLPRALPDAVPPVRPPTPEVPAPRPAEPAPGSPAPRPGAPTPAPRSGEPSSLPPETPRPTSPTESRPTAPAPHEATSTPAGAGEGAPPPDGHGVPEAAPAPAASPNPAGHDVPEAAPPTVSGAPKLLDFGGLASAASSAGENLPKLPDLGGIASSAAGAGDELVPAGVGAHSAEAAGNTAAHGHGGSAGGGPVSSSGPSGGGSDGGTGSHEPPGDPGQPGAGRDGDPTSPGGHNPHDSLDPPAPPSHNLSEDADHPGTTNHPELGIEKRDEILSLDKGARPDPSEYLSPQFIEQHLSQFRDGASRFMPEVNFEKYGISQIDGTSFFLPKFDADELLEVNISDPRALEAALGLPDHFLDDANIVRIDVSEPENYGLRMPSGNEAGANSQWLPGGFLPDGLPEAVIDGRDIPPDDYTITVVPTPKE
jgi:hypothetical protein